MRINELLEGKIFNDLDFVSHKQDGKREINYDLAEDLVHFMNQDDHVYRRIVHPTISKFIDLRDAKNKSVLKYSNPQWKNVISSISSIFRLENFQTKLTRKCVVKFAIKCTKTLLKTILMARTRTNYVPS